MMSEFPSQAQVVIIGGGVIGCSIAYNLAKDGVDAVVLEKNSTSLIQQADQYVSEEVESFL